mgnify:FL=1
MNEQIQRLMQILQLGGQTVQPMRYMPTQSGQDMQYMPAMEAGRNYANNEMPLYTGGLLQNPQGDMVDPQMLMNNAYDMNAPREMRIDAIERLRALGL